MSGRLLLSALLLLAVARPEAAMATEEPKYRVEKDYGEFEVRVYAPVIVAETTVEGEFGKGSNEGFRRLAGYIFGGNDGGRKITMTAPVGAEPVRPKNAGTKIDMTAPVGAQPTSEGWVVTFTMPSTWTMASLPVPDDDRVRLREVPGRRMAAVRFSGTWGAEKFESVAARLREQLKEKGLVPADEPPVFARYNPPWTPWFLRRNEVLVPLK